MPMCWIQGQPMRFAGDPQGLRQHQGQDTRGSRQHWGRAQHSMPHGGHARAEQSSIAATDCRLAGCEMCFVSLWQEQIALLL